jgi:hypothetical protein
MKRIPYLLLFPLILIFQTNAFSQVELGMVVGLDNSKLSGDKFENTKYKPKTGFILGITIDAHINDIISLSFQPGIVSSGSRIQVPDTIQDEYKDSVTVSIRYFRLPVYVKIQSKSKRLYFYSGLGFGYGLSLKADNEIEEVDISDELKKFNLSLDFGLGYKIPIKKSGLYFELRYSQGLLNVANPDPDEDYNVPRVKLAGIKILTGFQIPISKRTEIN